ncbi:MAG: RidA family protein [Streptosporangiaceae bacterium]
MSAARDYEVPITGFTSYTTTQGPGTLVFVSGITSRGAGGEIRAPGDVGGQAEQILRTMTGLLAEAGGTLNDVRQIRTYVLDIDTWPHIELVWRRHWPDGFPASTLVQVGRLFDARQLIETDAIAFISPDAPSSGNAVA